MSALRRNCAKAHVISMVDGSMRVELYYDLEHHPMWQDDGQWYGYPGVLTRMSIAADIERILNRAIQRGE